MRNANPQRMQTGVYIRELILIKEQTCAYHKYDYVKCTKD
jgi:hypothetical protein